MAFCLDSYRDFHLEQFLPLISLQEQCAFCHLCEPGERKRRKKERRMARREAQDRPVAVQKERRVPGKNLAIVLVPLF